MGANTLCYSLKFRNSVCVHCYLVPILLHSPFVPMSQARACAQIHILFSHHLSNSPPPPLRHTLLITFPRDVHVSPPPLSRRPPLRVYSGYQPIPCSVEISNLSFLHARFPNTIHSPLISLAPPLIGSFLPLTLYFRFYLLIIPHASFPQSAKQLYIHLSTAFSKSLKNNKQGKSIPSDWVPNRGLGVQAGRFSLSRHRWRGVGLVVS